MRKTLYYYFDGEAVPDIKIADIEGEKIEVFKDSVEKTRHFIELFKLYKIFRCNHELLIKNFTMLSNDTVVFRENETLNDEELETRINTFTINLLSSGNTLMESIDVYLNECLNEKLYDEFRSSVSSKIYDENLSYKLLRYLRNYSVHGHIPVEVIGSRASFNLDDIINKPHTSRLNKSVLEEMKVIRESILEQFGNHPRITYTINMADMCYQISHIYLKFLDFIKTDFKDTYENVQEIVNKHPEIVLDGVVYYDNTENFIQAFRPGDYNMSIFSEVKRIVQKDSKSDKSTYEELMKAFKKVGSIKDGQ